MSHLNLLMIGSSTGGLKVLEVLFPRLPVLNAAVVIVQHITPLVDKSFVTSLQRVSVMPVSLAQEGDSLQHGKVLLAPGGVHLYLVNNQKIHLAAGERVNSVCPSIDVSMLSVTPGRGGKMVGVILTGMGRDGADGIVHMKKCGSVTIAQDQKTSVIYGMPKAAAETGSIDFVLPIERIAAKLREMFG
ncbi:chemotaxis response regulator protein-glutamate methylesterase [Geobacter sp. OR-1]|uniref:CheB methylesterase domain-containing protein n=1 Tax=Geobacter sp. OR-1 TaxID=1266765 RepID=UPI0005422451|nr:CheB methylesterase domain-containing protein [Geobacter sp. OR-1]GAM08839.1 chemotaxis response regulator protein-glutamate methylesterase [Geobacter sp. OR-1]